MVQEIQGRVCYPRPAAFSGSPLKAPALPVDHFCRRFCVDLENGKRKCEARPITSPIAPLRNPRGLAQWVRRQQKAYQPIHGDWYKTHEEQFVGGKQQCIAESALPAIGTSLTMGTTQYMIWQKCSGTTAENAAMNRRNCRGS